MNNPPFQGVADNLAGYGRYGDSQLVHMNPAEVQGIASLVPGGKLTTNPVTGQPEAFLPVLLALGSSLGGSALGGAIASGIGLGAGSGIMGGALGKLATMGIKGLASEGIRSLATGEDFDPMKAVTSAATTFGVDKALGAAKDLANPAIGDTATALTDATEAASQAGVDLATSSVDAANPIAAAAEGVMDPLTGQMQSQAFSPVVATDPLTGITPEMNPALTSLQQGVTPYQSAIDAKNVADTRVAGLSDRLDALREDSSLRDIANMEGIKNVGKSLMSPSSMVPIAIGEGQRAQMEADEELERIDAMNEENRRKEYLRSLGFMDEAYGRLAQDYPGYMNTGGIVSLNPDDYMQRRDGFNSLGKTVHMNNGGKVDRRFDRARAEAQTQDAVSALENRGNISSSGLQELVQRLAPDADLSEFMHDFGPGSAADRQANIRGSQVITPQELAQLGRPGFGPEIQYFRRPDEAAPTPPPGEETPGPGGPGKGRDAGSDQFMNDLLARRNTPPPAPTSPAAPAADAQPIAATPPGSIEDIVADIQAPAVDPREMVGMYGQDRMPEQEAMPDITVAEDPMEEAIVPPIPSMPPPVMPPPIMGPPIGRGTRVEVPPPMAPPPPPTAAPMPPPPPPMAGPPPPPPPPAPPVIAPPDQNVPFVGPEMMGEDIAGIARLLAQREGRPPRGMRFMLAGGDTNMSPPVDPSQMPVGPAQQSADPTQVLIEQTIMAVLGQLPEEQAEVVINQFISEFGEEAFQMLREQALQSVVPGAQTEGMIEGEGGGMDDQVPGMIGNQQQVAVSPGEFIVPADVVSGLGDGSSDAGADKLDAMMDDVRVAKTGGTIQPGPINNRVIPV